MPSRRPTTLLPLALVTVAALAAGACSAGEKPTESSVMLAESPPPAAPSAGVGFAAADSAVAAPVMAMRRPVSTEMADRGASVSPAAAQTSTTAIEEMSSAIPTMLVRTGTATIEVDSLELALDAVRRAARMAGGFVSGTEFSGRAGDARRAATIALRVPSTRFDEVIAGLSPLGKIEALDVSTQDVGEEYTDMASRVTNARRLEQRLIDLLANRTGRLADVLTVERELARVREEIERMEGRMRFLASRASLSTITLTVHEEAPVLASPGGSRIGRAFAQAWDNFIDVVAALIATFGVVLPLALVGLAGFLAWRRWGRRVPTLPA